LPAELGGHTVNSVMDGVEHRVGVRVKKGTGIFLYNPVLVDNWSLFIPSP
jgi:hypothetical protein